MVVATPVRVALTRSGMAVRRVCELLVDTAGTVFLHLTVQASRLYSSGYSSRSSVAGRLPARSSDKRERLLLQGASGPARPGGCGANHSICADRICNHGAPVACGTAHADYAGHCVRALC